TTESFATPTRMKDYHPEAVISGTRIAHDNKAIVVNLARAGTFPSHICYDFLHNFLPPENVRQDHIFASRATDNSMNVIGTDLSAAKIGGDVVNSTVFFPDPMGATGNTIVSALEHYKKNLKGPARRYIALHLIVTPEYLKKVNTAHPDLEIYTFRVDRGLSSPDVLNSPYGKYWDQEKGLNEKGYIVPGGGGFGEIMNNSFV
ncbi:MAG: uracil phosphoribosyltransferase, partial [Bdellovibrionia bacterium]